MSLVTAWMLGCVSGFFIGVTVATIQRRPTCRDLMRNPEQRHRKFIRMDEGRIQRGNGSGEPTSPKPEINPKPQFPSPRIIRDDFLP